MTHGSCLGPVAYLLYASSLEEVITPPEPPALHQMTLKRNHQQQR